MVYYLKNNNNISVVCFPIKVNLATSFIFSQKHLVFCCFVLLGQTFRFHSLRLCFHFFLQLFPLCISLEYKKNFNTVEFHLKQRKKKNKKEKKTFGTPRQMSIYLNISTVIFLECHALSSLHMKKRITFLFLQVFFVRQ